MRYAMIALLLLAAAGCQSTAPHANGGLSEARKVAKGDSGFVVAFIGGPRPTPVPAAKVASLPDAVTLGQLVRTLGLGWINPRSGIGAIQWRLDDGRTLEITPDDYEPDIVLDREHRIIVPAEYSESEN